MPTSQRSTDGVIARAKLEGLTVVFPEKDELFLDLDNRRQKRDFVFRVGFFKAIHKGVIKNIRYTFSKSGNLHAYVKLNREVTDLERIFLQSLLGSDPKREIMSYFDYLRQEREPTLFFEKEIPAGRGLYPIQKFMAKLKKLWNTSPGGKKTKSAPKPTKETKHELIVFENEQEIPLGTPERLTTLYRTIGQSTHPLEEPETPTDKRVSGY